MAITLKPATPTRGISLGPMPSILQGSKPALQPTASPRLNVATAPMVQRTVSTPIMKPAVGASTIQPAVTAPRVQPAMGGVPKLNTTNPVNPPSSSMTYGFMDGSSYDTQGQQVKAPQFTPEQISSAMYVALNTPAPTTYRDSFGNILSGSANQVAPAQLPSTSANTVSDYEKAVQDAMKPTEEENKLTSDYLAAQQWNRQKQQEVQERPLDGTILRSGMEREMSNIANGNTRESLVNLRTQQTLAEKLALEQAKRTATFNASKFALERQDKKKDDLKPMEVGGNLVRLNPTTGKYETIFSTPKTGEYTMGFNPITGDPLIMDKNTGNIKGSPGNGTGAGDIIDNLVTQVQANPNLLSNLPEAMRKAVTARMAQSGFTIPDKPLSAEAAKVQAIASTMIPEVNLLKGMFEKDYKGSLQGMLTGTNRELVRLVDQIADKIGRLRSGGAINKDEEARFKRQLGSWGDLAFGDSTSAIQALNGLIAEAQSVSSSMGGNTAPTNGGSVDDLIRKYYPDFKGDLSMSVNGSYVKSVGPVTAYGSPLWKPGLDIDLKKGQPVPSPVSGTVVYVGSNGGFGNQVKVRDARGNEIWLSHLDGFNVKPGQQISRGTIIGKGGNSGNVIKMGGGDGSHLDLTIKTAKGFLTAKQVEQYVG